MLFEHGTIITVDKTRRIIQDGAILVRDGRIYAIGKTYELAEAFPDEPREDLRGDIVLPGLIDTHVHLAQAMIRGCADDLELIDWLGKRVWVLQGNYDEADGRASAELCIVEMLKSGTTAFLECMLAGRYGLDGIAEAVIQSGMRGALSKIVMDTATYASKDDWMHPGMREDRDTTVRQTLEAFDRWDGAADGRLQVWFGPRTPGGVTPELYREISRLARERNMGITVHLAEVRADREFLLKTYGLKPVEFAREVGLAGPRVVQAPVIWVDVEEIRLLAETGTHVAHNPASNSKLASGFARIAEMLQAGVNVSIGCDGGPSSNTYDLLRDLRWVCYLQKARLLDPQVVPAEAAIEMATINGAKALGWEDEIGSLEAGKKADFIVIDTRKPHLTPSPNPVSTVVHCATGADVREVVIGGKVVVRDGRVLTLDEEKVVRTARERAEALYRRAGVSAGPSWPVE
jgi:cytosine/adenosine deaminase-related metal-dependent hydrolase